jgi:hypothetical protein
MYRMRTASLDQPNPSAPSLVVTHGYGAALGFYFRSVELYAVGFSKSTPVLRDIAASSIGSAAI